MPLNLLSIEEFDRDSIYFWGIVGFNILAALAFASAAVLVYANDWGSIAWLAQ